MSFDAHANFARSTVKVAPSPATSGLSLTVQTGDGAKFPAAPFNATLRLDATHSEIVRVTAKVGDVFTIIRAQENSSAVAITTGMGIIAGITAKTIEDVEDQVFNNTPQNGVLTGFGVNYKNIQSLWQDDMDYFNSIGLVNIRPNLVGFPGSWSAGTPTPGDGSSVNDNAYWRLCAKTFAEAGFWVTWGITHFGTLTAANWSTFHDNVVAEAAYLQAQGIVLGDFELGNELENAVDGTTLTEAGLGPLVNQLAADVKAVNSTSPISIAINAGGGLFSYINTNGLGNLDTVSIHPYGNISTNFTTKAQTVDLAAFGNIATLTSKYGNKIYISEFNVDGSNSDLLSLNPTTWAAALDTILYMYMANGKVDKFFIYEYSEYLNNRSGDSGFAQRHPNRTFRRTWQKFFKD